MPPKLSIKPYKLKATDGPLSRDDLSTWEYNFLSFCRQNETWTPFVPGGSHSTWIATDDDETNGLVKYERDHETVNVAETNKFRAAFKDFLTSAAVNAPTGFTETILRESTSWKWIIDEIKVNFNLSTKGEQFLAGNEVKFDFNDNFTYQQGYMFLRDHYISAMPEEGTNFKGRAITTREKLSPLAELFIVEKWLSKIDPRLPNHIYKTRGYLFTEQRPTLACNQRVLADQIDTMLNELDGNSDKEFCVNAVNNRRGSSWKFNTYQQYNRAHRGFSRNRTPQQQFQRTHNPDRCRHCLEARRYDASQTHQSNMCPWPPRRSNTNNNPQNFKVMLLPNHNNVSEGFGYTPVEYSVSSTYYNQQNFEYPIPFSHQYDQNSCQQESMLQPLEQSSDYPSIEEL